MDSKDSRSNSVFGSLAGATRLLIRGAVVVILLALAAGLIFFLGLDHLDEEMRRAIEAKVQTQFPGLVVTLRSAKRVEDQGVELRGLTISETISKPGDSPIFQADEIFVRGDTSLPQMLTDSLKVSAVTVRRFTVYATRRSKGRWNLKHLMEGGKTNSLMCPIVLERGTARIADESRSSDVSIDLHDIQIVLDADVSKEDALFIEELYPVSDVKLTGSLRGDHVDRVEFAGRVDLKRKLWSLDAKVLGLQFTERLRRSLPRDLAEQLASLESIEGDSQFEAHVESTVDGERDWLFAINGSLRDGKIKDPRLSQPLTEVTARISVDENTLAIEEFQGRLGSAKIKVAARFDGPSHGDPYAAFVEVSDLNLSDVRAFIPTTEVSEKWHAFKPEGVISGEGEIRFERGNWTTHISAKLSDLSFQIPQNPYRFSSGTLGVKFAEGVLTANGEAIAGATPVAIRMNVRDPTSAWTGRVEFESKKPFPLDETFFSALPKYLQPTVRAFNAQGAADMRIEFERKTRSAPISNHIVSTLQNVSVKHRAFLYPIQGITGTVEGRDRRWEFRDLRGEHRGSLLTATGAFVPSERDGGELNLTFASDNLELDDDLAQGLSAPWDRFFLFARPRGRLDKSELRMTWPSIGSSPRVHVLARKSRDETRNGNVKDKLRLELPGGNSSLEIRNGEFEYEEGLMRFKGLDVAHGETDLRASGTCAFPGDGRALLDCPEFSVDGFGGSHDFAALLPMPARKFLASSKLSGWISARGSANVTAVMEEGTIESGKWDVTLDVEDAQAQSPAPLEHIRGEARLRGEATPGAWHMVGDVRADSLMFRDVQVTELQGPIYVDQEKVLIGSALQGADDGKAIESGRPRENMVAKVFGGTIVASGKVLLQSATPFQIQAELTDGDLSILAREAKAKSEDISGVVSAKLQMTGTARGKHTWRGGGNVRIRDADFLRSPIVSGLQRLIRLRRRELTSFTTGDIDYRIAGDDVIFDRIDLGAQTLTLKGRGQLRAHRTVDLQFYTQLGRDEIQLAPIRSLFAETSPRFLLIEVTGTPDDPQLHNQTFPALNESLRRLFPELANEGDDEGPRTAREPSFKRRDRKQR